MNSFTNLDDKRDYVISLSANDQTKLIDFMKINGDFDSVKQKQKQEQDEDDVWPSPDEPYPYNGGDWRPMRGDDGDIELFQRDCPFHTGNEEGECPHCNDTGVQYIGLYGKPVSRREVKDYWDSINESLTESGNEKASNVDGKYFHVTFDDVPKNWAPSSKIGIIYLGDGENRIHFANTYKTQEAEWMGTPDGWFINKHDGAMKLKLGDVKTKFPSLEDLVSYLDDWYEKTQLKEWLEKEVDNFLPTISI